MLKNKDSSDKEMNNLKRFENKEENELKKIYYYSFSFYFKTDYNQLKHYNTIIKVSDLFKDVFKQNKDRKITNQFNLIEYLIENTELKFEDDAREVIKKLYIKCLINISSLIRMKNFNSLKIKEKEVNVGIEDGVGVENNKQLFIGDLLFRENQTNLNLDLHFLDFDFDFDNELIPKENNSSLEFHFEVKKINKIKTNRFISLLFKEASSDLIDSSIISMINNT